MKPVSLLDVSSYLPENRVPASYFGTDGDADQVMFNPPPFRHHARPTESNVDMIELATRNLVARNGIRAIREADVLITHSQLPDQPIFGCGAEVAQRLKMNPRWIFDLHNGSCAAFVNMIELATQVLRATDARSALICCTQNMAGSVFSQSRVRTLPQAAIPGDGAGTALLVADHSSPILDVRSRHFPEHAGQMGLELDGDRKYWEPGEGQARIGFTESKIREVLIRGKKVVPELVGEVCEHLELPTTAIDVLVTNQPNRLFLRSWRTTLGLPPERHPDTFDDCGNLFGAGIPVTLDRAVRDGTVQEGSLLVLSAFAHAGDYVGAAAVRWRP